MVGLDTVLFGQVAFKGHQDLACTVILLGDKYRIHLKTYAAFICQVKFLTKYYWHFKAWSQLLYWLYAKGINLL